MNLRVTYTNGGADAVCRDHLDIAADHPDVAEIEGDTNAQCGWCASEADAEFSARQAEEAQQRRWPWAGIGPASR